MEVLKWRSEVLESSFILGAKQPTLIFESGNTSNSPNLKYFEDLRSSLRQTKQDQYIFHFKTMNIQLLQHSLVRL